MPDDAAGKNAGGSKEQKANDAKAHSEILSTEGPVNLAMNGSEAPVTAGRVDEMVLSWSGAELDWWRGYTNGDHRIVIDFYPVITFRMLKTFDGAGNSIVDGTLSCANAKVSNWLIKKPNIGITLYDRDHKFVEALGFGAPRDGCGVINSFNRTVRMNGDPFNWLGFVGVLAYQFTWEAC